jgi:aarF domain-containing kinase
MLLLTRAARRAPRIARSARLFSGGDKNGYVRRAAGRKSRRAHHQSGYTKARLGGTAASLAACGSGVAYCQSATAPVPAARTTSCERAVVATTTTATGTTATPAATVATVSATRVALRALTLGVLFSPTVALAPFALVSRAARSLWYSVLVWCLSKAGPTFIKLGQWLSTRPDIFPVALCQKLSYFHEQVPAEPWSLAVQETIEAATCDAGQTLSDIFIAFDRVPIGAGCVAQVYRARLRPAAAGAGDTDTNTDGTVEVAVKVKRTDVDVIISVDLHILRMVARTATRLFPELRWINLEGCASEFSKLLASQLDFREEASNLRRFRENFSCWEDTVVFPRPISRLCGRNVLIESFEQGVSLSAMLHRKEEDKTVFYSDTHRSKASEKNTEKRIADVGSRAFFEMVLVHNFVHADLHPGNILVQQFTSPPSPPFDEAAANEQTENSNSNKPTSSFRRLVFLDAGLTTSLSQVGRRNFIDLFSAVCDADGDQAARLMVERSEDPASCRDIEGFVSGMRGLIDRVADTTFSLGQVRIGQVLLRVMDLCQQHHVRVDDTMAQLVSSIAILDGLGRQLDPDRDLFDTARPILKRFFSLHPDYRKFGLRSLLRKSEKETAKKTTAEKT